MAEGPAGQVRGQQGQGARLQVPISARCVTLVSTGLTSHIQA